VEILGLSSSKKGAVFASKSKLIWHHTLMCQQEICRDEV